MSELSVIVCTHDRPDDLDRCLEGLALLEPQPEVIVVDSASAVPAAPVVGRHRDRIPGVQCLRVEQPGLSLARNAGIAAASRSLIAFVDDDAVPLAGWAAAIERAFEDPRIGCVGGACQPDFAVPRPAWLSDRLLQLAGITRFGSQPRKARSSAEWPFGANMAFRRATLDQVGGFSPALGRVGRSLLSGEDSEMVARTLTGGWLVWLDPRAIVDHRVSAERCHSRYYWKRFWWNGISRAVRPRGTVTVRVLCAAPVRVLLWALSGDRVYLYRLAETVGYLAARAGIVATR